MMKVNGSDTTSDKMVQGMCKKSVIWSAVGAAASQIASCKIDSGSINDASIGINYTSQVNYSSS